MSTEQSSNEENDATSAMNETPPPAPSAAPAESPPPPPAAAVETPPPAPAPVASSGENPKDKKILCGILAIVIGWLGIHKFLLGYKNEGIIMCVVGVVGYFLCGIPTLVVAIVGLIEGITYLTKTDAEFERIYMTGRKPWF